MNYSNLAYKLDEENYLEDKKENKSVRVRTRKVKKNFRPIVYALILCMAAYYMISKNVDIYETEQQIKTLQGEIAKLESYTSQRAFELEQSMDLSEIERIAKTRLNMQRPEQYQIEYVNVKRDDVTEVTANEVEGLSNKVKKTTESLKRNVAGIFSIGMK